MHSQCAETKSRGSAHRREGGQAHTANLRGGTKPRVGQVRGKVKLDYSRKQTA